MDRSHPTDDDRAATDDYDDPRDRTEENGPHPCDDCGETTATTAAATSWNWLCEDCHDARQRRTERHRNLMERRRESVHGAPQEGVEAKIVYESNRSGDEVEAVVTVESVEGRRPQEDVTGLHFRGYDEKRDRTLHVWMGGKYDPDHPRYNGEDYAAPEVWSESTVLQGDTFTTRHTTLGEPVAVYFPQGYAFDVTVEGITDDEAERVAAAVEKAARQAAGDSRHSYADRDAPISVDVDGPERLDRQQ